MLVSPHLSGDADASLGLINNEGDTLVFGDCSKLLVEGRSGAFIVS